MAAPARVAVLGATGSVGRQVCAAFARDGYDVVAIARHDAPHTAGYDFRPVDVAATGPARLADLFARERVGVVVNASGGWGRTEDEMRYAHVHLVERLVAALRQLPDRTRLVQVGSIHEYGPAPDGTLIDELVEPRPTTPYARTKLAGARAVLAATGAGEVDGVVLRAVNVCGPHTTTASFLGALVARLRDPAAARGMTLSIADARRDYIDVRDLADAVVAAARAPVGGRVLNIGRGEAVGMRELVRLLVAAAGFPPDLITEEPAPLVSKGGGWTCADIRLAGDLLGWRPQIDLPEAMRAMWLAAEPGARPSARRLP